MSASATGRAVPRPDLRSGAGAALVVGVGGRTGGRTGEPWALPAWQERPPTLPNMSDEATNEDVVRRFCAAFSRRDVAELVDFFADDAVYHNIPLAPANGKEAIRTTLESFVPGSPDIE